MVSNFEPMLGKEAHRHRGKTFWYCCPGHDDWGRDTRIIRKRIERRRSNRETKKEAGYIHEDV